MRAYVAVARGHRPALDAMERYLEALPLGVVVTRASLKSASKDLAETDDQVLVIAHALKEIGVLESVAGGWSVSARGVEETRGYRSGVREALDSAPLQGLVPTSSQILVAPPPAPPSGLQNAMSVRSIDLRFAVFDLIASARSELLLVSPFWDGETLAELQVPLQGRLDAGVKITLLTRHVSAPLSASRVRLRHTPGQYRLFTWFRRSGSGQVSTFHVKAVVQDRGERAYLGSANLTLASLRSRMEIGVRLDGPVAGDLSEILYASLDLATEST